MHDGVPKEIVALAKHQKEIIERRFPNMRAGIYDYVNYSTSLMVVGNENDPAILQIRFYSNSIEIVWDEDTTVGRSIVDLDYADPNFTDDTISDILKAWEEAHPPEVMS